MNDLKLNFGELPLWLEHKNASKVLNSKELKKLRQDRGISFKTIDGKLHYPLMEVLQHAGVEVVSVFGEVELIKDKQELVLGSDNQLHPADIDTVDKNKPLAADEIPFDMDTPENQEARVKEEMEKHMPAPEEPKEPAKEESKPKYFYTDVFSFPSSSLPADVKIPTFRTRTPNKEVSYSTIVEGYITDIQWYMAQYGNEDPFPKARFFMQSKERPNNYRVFGFRMDKHTTAHIVKAMCNHIIDKNNYVKFTVMEGTSGKFKFDIGGKSLDNGSGYIPPVKPLELEILLSESLTALDATNARIEGMEKKFDSNYFADYGK